MLWRIRVGISCGYEVLRLPRLGISLVNLGQLPPFLPLSLQRRPVEPSPRLGHLLSHPERELVLHQCLHHFLRVFHLNFTRPSSAREGWSAPASATENLRQ